MTDDTTDIDDRLDRLESHLEVHRQRLLDHEATAEAARQQLADCDTEPEPRTGVGLAAGGVLAALGLAAATGTAAADPRGQVGAEDRPVEVVHTAALAGPLTGGEELDSLVGSGLTVEDGELTLSGGN